MFRRYAAFPPERFRVLKQDPIVEQGRILVRVKRVSVVKEIKDRWCDVSSGFKTAHRPLFSQIFSLAVIYA